MKKDSATAVPAGWDSRKKDPKKETNAKNAMTDEIPLKDNGSEASAKHVSAAGVSGAALVEGHQVATAPAVSGNSFETLVDLEELSSNKGNNLDQDFVL